MTGLLAVLGAIVPIFVLILLGHLFRRTGFLPETMWRGIEKLTYYALFPSLIIDNLARADLAGLPVLPMAAGQVSAILTVSLVLMALRTRIGLNGPAFTSLFQGAVRPNTYIVLATAAALFQGPGIALCATGLAAVVPLVNVLCVLVLTRYGAGSQPGMRAVLRGIVTNPIIIAVVIGLALNLSGLGRPPLVGPVLKILADGALSLGLLAVGAGLSLSAARSAGHGVGLAALLKLAAAPGVTGLVAAMLGAEGMPLAVAVLFNAAPAAPASYVLARLMGGDHQLMAGVITTETVLAALTIPLVLVLFG